MPLYEYTCEKCEHQFETLVRGNEKVACPECHSDKVQRQWSLPARPVMAPSASANTCKSDGPPCGPVCGRWQG